MIDDVKKIEFVEEVLANLPKDHNLTMTLGDATILEKLHETCVKVGISPDKASTIRKELLCHLSSQLKPTLLTNLHALTSQCIKCPEMAHDAAMPLWNYHNPDVVFVIENPNSLNNEGGKLFRTALVKSGFKSERTALSYVTRCTKSSKNKIQIKEIQNCTEYLFTELQAMKPKLIITLGAISAHVLLGNSIKMDSDPSESFYWLGPWPVMAIYSPNYVMNPKNNLENKFYNLFNYAYNFVYGKEF